MRLLVVTLAMCTALVWGCGETQPPQLAAADTQQSRSCGGGSSKNRGLGGEFFSLALPIVVELLYPEGGYGSSISS